jgi:hypothetical protein
MRSQRGSKEKEGGVDRSKTANGSSRPTNNKSNRPATVSGSKSSVVGSGSDTNADRAAGGKKAAKELSDQVMRELINGNTRDDSGDIGSMELTKIVVDNNTDLENIGVPGQPGSKMKRLKRMVDEAEKKRMRLEELRGQGKDGKERYVQFIISDI